MPSIREITFGLTALIFALYCKKIELIDPGRKGGSVFFAKWRVVVVISQKIIMIGHYKKKLRPLKNCKL